MKNNKRKIKLFLTFILSCISILGLSQTTPPQSFHDAKGNIEVTQAGQLQYTLAIDLPPGIKNTAPNINLVYVSGAGNGLAGYGWNISGLTSISRVGKNLEKDGVKKAVQLDYSDYYSFNGQRLILKSGEYGKDGAEYVTEKYSNIKIKSVGATTGQGWQGPEYWEVTFDDGSQAWYGAITSGSNSARTPIDYNIVKSKDVNGNYITYKYSLENNVTVISSIEWGGNEVLNTPHINKIEFVFLTRPASETAHIKGIYFSQSKMLESVIVSTGDKQYKKYSITYKKDERSFAYRFLDKITILNSNNQESNPVIFTYENPQPSGWVVNETLRPGEKDLTGDFDGDGNLDLLRYYSTITPQISQTGLYLYSDVYGYSNKVFLGNSIDLSDLRYATITNLKKNNTIYSRQGFNTVRQINNPSTTKLDLELSFYSITDDNQLHLDYKKIIPNADYDRSTGSVVANGTRTKIIVLKNVDFNGDGLSEFILQLNDNRCVPINPTDPIPTGKVSKCEATNRYIVIDPDQAVQNNAWYYEISLDNNVNEDAFVDYRMGDFNGDGLFDFLKLTQDKIPLLITFKKNTQGKYESELSSLYSTTIGTLQGLWEDSVVGDYNGDGLSDIMMPNGVISPIWYLYTSKGNSFKEETRTFEPPMKARSVTQENDGRFTILNPRTFIASDINNDGKTDLISLQSSRYYKKHYVQDNNQAVKYVMEHSIMANILPFGTEYHQPYYSYNSSRELYLNQSNLQEEIAPNSSYDVMGVAVDQSIGNMLRKLVLTGPKAFNPNYPDERQIIYTNTYFDTSMAARIKSISQGGITTDIFYKQLDKKNPGLYGTAKTENYPYVEIDQSVGIYVVSGLTQSTMSDKKLKQDFRYRGLTSNILGRGMIGFRKTARSSWYADGFENTKIWSGVEIDPTNDGIPVKEWSIRTNDEAKIFPEDISENNTQLLSFKSTTYQIDKILNGQVVATVSDADKAKAVTAIVPKTNRGKDFLTGSTAESTITYGEYYLPLQSTANINGGYSVKTSTYEYNNNPTGIATGYYIGRIKSKTEVVQAYSDTKSGKEEYTYENNQIKTIKKWNGDNTGNILETYNYDGFGNGIQKLVANSIDSQSQTAKTEYDAKGRFVIKTTDNLGLETHLTYNDWGQVLTQTDPMGNVQTNTYDNWGKLATSKTNLNGLTSYLYERDKNSNTIVTQSKADGDISQTFTNKLGQVYKVSAKASIDGQFISKDTQYDLLGRKIKESEPFFESQGVSKWNVMEYDDSTFPVKVKATAFTGKQTETVISGFTTTVKELNGYGRITSKTTDPLGNVISSTDKGGTIQFSYNAAGNQTQAKYAENSVSTKYDSWGRKSEFNDPSNGVYKYEYTGLGLPKKTISPKGNKEYVYNNLGQLTTQKEFSTIDNGQTTNKTISFIYNEKGLLTKKSGTLKGQVFSTDLTYDPHGRLISSTENSNGKTYKEKGITFDNNGKVISYEKELQSGGTITKFTVENIYNTWNGELFQIKDKNSGKVLWELNGSNAKGQVLKAKLGANEITNVYDSNGFLTAIKHSSQINPAVLQMSYSFDAIKNELKSRTTAGDFNIVESFDYDDNNRLINWTNPITGVKPSTNRNIYDAKGRITGNDQVGSTKFENAAKIYQPTAMALNAAGTQNYNGDLIQTIIYNENNDPVLISGERTRVNFEYGLNGMRQRVEIERLKNPGGGATELKMKGDNIWNPDVPLWQSKLSKVYNEDGSFEVIVDQSTGREKHILYVEGDPYASNVIYLKSFGESTGSYKFLHKDYIGSILAITDEAGNKLEQRHYDAWGNFTHLKLGNAPVTTDRTFIAGASLLIDRGYTGHEHFSEVGIIHMNGRLYDPLLRRFLNADENIQDPMNTQNYNKYGYVMNNPLMYNDPSGEFLMWLAGALVGGYLNGVAANGGNWNPGNWDWERTWSAVLGGAIGGAAVSGALGNISSSAGAIKNFLPGIVSGGLNSAFNGGNFLGGAVGGLSYTGNLFDNRITSANMSISYRYMRSSDSENGVFGKNSISTLADPLNVVLSIYGLKPYGPANIYSLSIIAPLFAPKNTWIGIGSPDAMDEWAKKYIKFSVDPDGLFIDPADPKIRIKGITNPVTGRIILAPGLFNGKRSNYGLAEVIIHEVGHFENWKKNILQGNHPLIEDLNEVSSYLKAAEWTKIPDSGIYDYLNSMSDYMLMLNIRIIK
ncbi:type IV secretion protein Rhs [Chryseobacterium pennae]|uniref:Type IV secretion protein Rhs n=1 Tax=Chryseobacterium pennae TaxID=2258962 RepID=A0A3D9CD57_9FLAO|nr:RHS repeat-associated core domain-containing protein [Chryseobacterium pennae]REC63441.1 type IV secretion protein Rhs [Chryseobacterium pennae]